MAIRPYTGPGGRYRVYFRHQGRMYSRVVPTLAAGKAWEVEMKTLLAQAEARASVLMFSQAADLYLIDSRARMLPATVAEKFRHLKAFAAFLGADLPAQDVTVAQAKAFIAAVQAKLGNKTANRHLRTLKAMWNWHRDTLPANVWQAVQPYPEDEFLKYIPPPDNVAAVLKEARRWEERMLLFLLSTGARSGEAFNLTWEDVNLERGTVILWTRKRKGGSRQARLLPISPTLRAILEELARENAEAASPYVFVNPETGEPYYRQLPSVRLMLKRLCRKAGVKEFGFHALRHYVASRLMESQQANIVEIQRLLGHQRTTTTDAYLKSLSSGIGHLAGIIETAVLPKPPQPLESDKTRHDGDDEVLKNV